MDVWKDALPVPVPVPDEVGILGRGVEYTSTPYRGSHAATEVGRTSHKNPPADMAWTSDPDEDAAPMAVGVAVAVVLAGN
jgi:hypothetical protein